MNFNALQAYCIAFTPKWYKLNLPPLHSLPISYTDSINLSTPGYYLVVTTVMVVGFSGK